MYPCLAASCPGGIKEERYASRWTWKLSLFSSLENQRTSLSSGRCRVGVLPNQYLVARHSSQRSFSTSTFVAVLSVYQMFGARPEPFQGDSIKWEMRRRRRGSRGWSLARLNPNRRDRQTKRDLRQPNCFYPDQGRPLWPTLSLPSRKRAALAHSRFRQSNLDRAASFGLLW